MNIFLSISFNISFGCSKEPSHRDGSYEYPQHMFWLRSKKLEIYSFEKKITVSGKFYIKLRAYKKLFKLS